MNYYRPVYGDYNTIVGYCDTNIYIYNWTTGEIDAYFLESTYNYDYDDYDCSYDFDYYTLFDAHYDPKLKMKHNFRGKGKKERTKSSEYRQVDSNAYVVDEYKIDNIPFEVNVMSKHRRQVFRISYTLIPVGEIDDKYIVTTDSGILSILDFQEMDEREYEYTITYTNKNLDFIDSL